MANQMMTQTPPKETGVLFRSHMVDAILRGNKTQTRRPCQIDNNDYYSYSDEAMQAVIRKHSPYGGIGDKVWVRETWSIGTRPDQQHGWRDGIEYKADETQVEEWEDLILYPIPDDVDYSKWDNKNGWIPSIFMPRWASRITLEIIHVRLERLCDISGKDAIAEGIILPDSYPYTGQEPRQSNYLRREYMRLWKSLYGEFESDAWVWVYEWEPFGVDKS